MTAVVDALAAYSGWLRYGHEDRAQLWIDRLELNRPELEAFAAAESPDEQPYVAGAVPLVAPDGLRMEAPSGADAEGARQRAAADRHKAFTFVPEAAAAGIPVAVKDLMTVAGMPFTAGSKAIGAEVATRDAEVVARLRRAGFSVIGLANLHEFAYGITSANPHFGAVVNPAAPDRIPGGSSGGSAAAVAAGVVDFAVGTDTAGSIRIPAACCGIVGFKPSYDAVPRSGVVDLGFSLDHVGPMTRTVHQAAFLFAAMLGLAEPPPWGRRDLHAVRIARLRGFFEEPLDDEVRAALDDAAKALQGDGAHVADATPERMQLAAATQFVTLCAEAGAAHMERVRVRGADYGADTRVRVEIANFIPSHWYVKAQRLRSAIVRAIDTGFATADVFLCATLRTPAPKVGTAHVRMGGRDYPLHTAITQLTMPFNLAGLPAVSVPWSRSREGVPICLQVVAPRGQDWRALAVAQRLQALATF